MYRNKIVELLDLPYLDEEKCMKYLIWNHILVKLDDGNGMES